MAELTPIEEKKTFLKNDRLLVCGMFAVYGICILGLIGLTFWGLNRRSETISANATSTAQSAATRQAKVTATAVARRAEQAKYEFTDRFDNNRKEWHVGSEDDEYWSGSIAVQKGVYLWNAKEIKQGFVYSADFPASDYYHDFDVYVDTKIAKDASGEICSGIMFRKTYDEDTEESSYYYYSLCNDSMVYVNLHTGEDEWEELASVPVHFSAEEWKRLEVSARGSHFVLSINGQVIYEMDDEREKKGGVALVIEMSEKSSGRIYFDNFGYQPR